MRKRPKISGLILLFVILPLFPCSAESKKDFNINGVFSDIETFSAFSPREQGSKNETALFEFIEQRLNQQEIAYTVETLENRGNGFSLSRFIEVTIPGQSAEELILVVPVDSNGDIETAQARAVNPALALELIRLCNLTPRHLTLRVLFLGAEREEQGKVGQTSEYYIQQFFAGQKALVLYLDLEGIPEIIRLSVAAKKMTAPLWAVNIIRKAAEENNLGSRLHPARINTYRTGLSSTPSPLYPYLRDEIPAVLLETEQREYLRMPDQQVAVYHMLEMFLNLLDDFPNGMPETWDRNYLVLSFESTTFIINETVFTFSLLILLSIAMLTVFLQGRKVVLNIKKEVKYLWSLPLFFMIVFIMFFVSTLILEYIGILRNFPLMWQERPYLFLFFKIGFPTFLSFFFLHIIGGLPISRSPHFYSYSALLLIVLDIIILAVYHPVMTVPYVWVLLWAFFFILTRRAVLKAIFTAIAFLPGLLWLGEMLSIPSYPLLDLLILSRIGGNFLLTVFVLPFIFLFASINNHAYHYNKTRERYGMFISIGVVGSLTMACAMYLLLLYTPFADSNQPLDVVQVINSSEKIQNIYITSPAPLNDFILYHKQKPYLITGKTREQFIELPYQGRPPEYRVERNRFLNRENFIITVYPETSPREYSLRLSSTQNIAIFESNYPFTLKPDGKSAVIFTGINPPSPLELRFTLSRKGDLTLQLEEIYEGSPHDISVIHQNSQIDYQTRITYMINL